MRLKPLPKCDWDQAWVPEIIEPQTDSAESHVDDLRTVALRFQGERFLGTMCLVFRLLNKPGRTKLKANLPHIQDCKIMGC